MSLMSLRSKRVVVRKFQCISKLINVLETGLKLHKIAYEAIEFSVAFSYNNSISLELLANYNAVALSSQSLSM